MEKSDAGDLRRSFSVCLPAWPISNSKDPVNEIFNYFLIITCTLPFFLWLGLSVIVWGAVPDMWYLLGKQDILTHEHGAGTWSRLVGKWGNHGWEELSKWPKEDPMCPSVTSIKVGWVSLHLIISMTLKCWSIWNLRLFNLIEQDLRQQQMYSWSRELSTSSTLVYSQDGDSARCLRPGYRMRADRCLGSLRVMGISSV